MMQMIWLIWPLLIKIWSCFVFSSITSSWIHFQLGWSTQIFKVLTFEDILFPFFRINLGEKTRFFFLCGALHLYVVHKMFIEMSLFQGICSALCPYHSHSNFHTNSWVFENLPIYRKLIHDNLQALYFENQESIDYMFLSYHVRVSEWIHTL